MSDPSLCVPGQLGFSEPMDVRPKFHANDTTRDVLNVVQRTVAAGELTCLAANSLPDTDCGVNAIPWLVLNPSRCGIRKAHCGLGGCGVNYTPSVDMA